MPKYKTLSIKNFRGGEGQEYFDIENKIYHANKTTIDYDKGSLKNSSLLIESASTNIYVSNSAYKSPPSAVQYTDGYYYRLALSDLQHAIIQKSTNGYSSWSTVFDLPIPDADDHLCYDFQIVYGRLVAVIHNNNSYEVCIYQSTAPSTTWTLAQAITYGADPCPLVQGDTETYFIGQTGTIYTTTDAITWTLFPDCTRDYIQHAEFYHGFLYLMQSTQYRTHYLSRIEGSTCVRLRTMQSKNPPTMHKTGEYLIFISKLDKFIVSAFDGSTLSQIAKIPGIPAISQSSVKFLGDMNDKSYYAFADSSYDRRFIISISSDLTFIQEQEFDADTNCINCYPTTDGRQIFTCFIDAVTDKISNYYSSLTDYCLSAPITTSIAQVGPHIPIGLVATFKPGIYHTEADTYPFTTPNIRIITNWDIDQNTETIDLANVTTNKALTYKTYATNAHVNASKMSYAEYKYTKATGEIPYTYNLVQFFITLETSSAGTEFPELLSLQYIYEPTGIINV